MPGSDRTQLKQAIVGSISDSRTVTNGPLVVAQEAQRYVVQSVGNANLGATANLNLTLARVERPVQVKECRILPGGALTLTAGNFATVNFGYTNDNGGSLTVVAGASSNAALNTAVYPGATGNWAYGISILCPLNPNANVVVPSGSSIQVNVITTGGAGVAIPANTAFQMLWEEV